MKRCPTCSRVYDDVLLCFCLDDGTELIDKPEPPPPTLALPAEERPQSTIAVFQPPAPPPYLAEENKPRPRPRRVGIWILAIGLLVGIATVGIFAVMMLRKDPLTWYVVVEVDPNVADRGTVTSKVQRVIEQRLYSVGIHTFKIEPQGNLSSGRLIVRLPAVSDPDRIKKLIGTQGKLEFVHVISPPSPAPVLTYDSKDAAAAALKSANADEAKSRVLPYAERDNATQKKWVVVESPAIIDGAAIRNASAVPAYEKGNYEISFTLKPDGADKFGTWTGAHINEYLGIALNDEVRSTAFIRSQIFDAGEINGRFTKQSAEDLALILKSGALAAPVTFVEEGVVK